MHLQRPIKAETPKTSHDPISCNMPKSEFKLLIAEMAPHCIEDSSQCPENFPVVIDDIIVKLTTFVQSLRSDFSEKTIDDIVESVYKPIVTASKTVPYYVALMDKYSHVTIAKQAEQKSRDQQQKQDNEKRSDEIRQIGENGINCLEKSIEHKMNSKGIAMPGCAWHRGFTSDRTLKKFIVRIFTERAIAKMPSMMAIAGVPGHHRIIIDGENRESECMVVACGTEQNTQVDKELERELANTFGEFDVAHLHYLKSPILQRLVNAVPSSAFLVSTVDTDMIIINALRSTDSNYPDSVRIGMGLSKRTVLNGTVALTGRMYYFDPRAIRNWGDNILSNTSHGFGGLVEIFHLAGSDFNHTGVPGVGNLTLLKGYMTWAVRNQTRTPGDFYKHTLSQQRMKLCGVKTASQRSRDLKRKCDELETHAIHPIRRAAWVTNEYWNEVHSPDPIGKGYRIRNQENGHVCFAEEYD